jgi:hypothetical protein
MWERVPVCTPFFLAGDYAADVWEECYFFATNLNFWRAYVGDTFVKT